MKLSNITTIVRAKVIADTYKGWIKKSDCVCDIGCGNAVASKYLKESFNLKNISGCDLFKYTKENIIFKTQESKTKLPFQNNQFNLSMLNDVLHHVDYNEQEKLINEALRISGMVLIFELNPSLFSKIGDYLLNKLHYGKMNISFTYRKRSDWIILFKKMKLNYVVREVKTPFLYPFDHFAFKVFN